jgi:hypothetical protein
MMQQLFREDHEEALRLIGQSDSLALARYADGEACVLRNITVGNKDGWLFKKDKNLVFRRDLRQSLLCNDNNYYFGLSCSCCDKENHDYLLGSVRAPLSSLTFSNIWVNANYPSFNERFFPTIKATGKSIILCSGSKARVSELAKHVPVADFIPIPGNCVLYWEKYREQIRGLMDLKATQYSNAIFLFAIGPLSEILIHEMWQANQQNIYLDIGSTLDPFMFRRKSRSYHTVGHMLSQRVCSW